MEKKATLDISVSPRSSRNKIITDESGNIRVYLKSAPVDGRANAECIDLFSKRLRIPKSNIKITIGKKGRRKRIVIIGLSSEEAIDMLMDDKH